MGTNGTGGGQAHVGDQDVGPGFGHGDCALGIEDVGRGEQSDLVCQVDHFDLTVVAQVGFLEVRAKRPVDQAHGREVLHAGESGVLDLLEKVIHQPHWINATHAGQDGGAPHHRQTSLAMSRTISLASPKGMSPASDPCPAIRNRPELSYVGSCGT